MNSVADIAIGTTVEVIVFTVIGAVTYRLFAGRFLIPKREIVLPYQRGVLVSGSKPTRNVEPGSCWVRPGYKLLLCDVRPRTLQAEHLEVLSSEGTSIWLSLSGEYRISDPNIFFKASANAGDALWFELRRTISSVCRQWSAAAISSAGGAEALALRLLSNMRESSMKLGMQFLSLRVWEIVLGESVQRTFIEHDDSVQ